MPLQDSQLKIRLFYNNLLIYTLLNGGRDQTLYYSELATDYMFQKIYSFYIETLTNQIDIDAYPGFFEFLKHYEDVLDSIFFGYQH